MTDTPISLTDYKLKAEEESQNRHNKRLEETVNRINRMASEGKVIVTRESDDGKEKHIENLKEILKHYTDWGFSPGDEDHKGYFRHFYIPDGAGIPMFQDLYTMEFRPYKDGEEQPDE